MLDSETKRHIDAARQVLVGVVPNPTSQVEQITNALLYKFMDDMDQAAIKIGGKPSFFTDDLEHYAWARIMRPGVGNQERMNLYGEALTKFSRAKQLPPLFREIFADAFLSYRSPETLGLFLKEIDYFDYSHPEELGNAYEYLLLIMASQGDAGQFRTPRNIIDFIVDVVNPTKDDKILDPACGTGGFLVSSYRRILEQHDGKNDPEKKEKPLTPDERKRLMNNLEGYDIDPGMARIARVNMYLHQFKNPRIHRYDTLSSDERWRDKFSVIMANPPFMSPKGGIRPHSKFSIKSSRSEVLFVDYIMDHLRPNGRAGIIVPEGIIFQSSTAYKELRKKLVEDGLYAVVSLPGGVFQPYSGVKTSILLFNNEVAKQHHEILFVKIENDGFALGATRQPINKNDLPVALDILNGWQTGEKSNSKLALYVEKTKIAEDGEYNLTGDRYRETVDYSNVKWPMVELGEILQYEQPTNYLVESTDYKDEYNTPVLTAGKSFLLGYTNEENGIFQKKNLPVIIFDDFTTATKFVDFPFKVKSSAMKILKLHGNANIRFVFHMMQKIKFNAYQHKRYWISQYSKIKIPLPPLEVQERIVMGIDQHQRVIDGAKQVIQTWKPSFRISPEWEKVKLGTICEIGSSKRVFEAEWKSKGVPFYRAREIVKLAENGFVDNELFISEDMFSEYSQKYGQPTEGDLMVTGVGTLGVCYRVRKDDGFYFKDGNIIWLKKFSAKANSQFIKYLFSNAFVKDQITAGSTGGTVGTYTITNAKNTIIPLPPLSTQKQLITEIEAEQKAIDENKNLIRSMENKVNAKIAEVWGEH